jgi:hypothetical protein
VVDEEPGVALGRVLANAPSAISSYQPHRSGLPIAVRELNTAAWPVKTFAALVPLGPGDDPGVGDR